MSATTTKQPAWKGVADLQKLNLDDLRAEYERVTGKATKSRNRKQLFATLAKKLQESGNQPGAGSVLTTKFNRKKTRGAKRPDGQKPSKKGRAKATSERATKPLGKADPRLPQVGSIITKTYKGKKLGVKVTETGFEYGGKPFRSLSAIAKEVTGSIWNGFLFFGLTSRPKKES